MAGPWEDFQASAGPRGPWDDYAPPGIRAPGPREAKDIGDAIISGLQSSSGGLIGRGKLPDMTLGADAPWYMRVAAGVGGIAGDAPAMFVGGALGTTGGAAAGSVVPGVGTAAGGLVGGGAGAFGLPMALRDGLIAAYNNDHAFTWEGAWEIAQASLKGGGKGALIGAATLGTGGVVGRAVGSAVAPGVGITMTGRAAVATAETAAAGAELVTLTGTAAALEGHMPTWQDFMDNAVLLGGTKAAIGIAKGMRNSYAETGRSPEQQLADALKDPTIALDLKPVEVATGNGITAYHGSPYTFEQFDVSKIGSGEGAQAYGHGLYFAESSKVAESYRRDLSKTYSIEEGPAYEYLRQAGSDWDAALKAADKYNTEINNKEWFSSKAREVLETKGGGAHYKVEINVKPEQMLNWDAPLTEQPAVVQAFAESRLGSYLKPREGERTVGETLRRVMKEGDPEQDMHAAGIKGIRYLDGDSRTKGNGTRNYVIFDAADVKVVERNGEAVGTSSLPKAYEPQALAERIRAALDPADVRPEQIRQSLDNLTPGSNTPKLGDHMLTDPVKYEYVTDSATAAGLHRTVTELFQSEILKQTRGVVPNKQSAAEALDMVAGGGVSPHIVGSAANAAEVLARAHVLKGATNVALSELAKIKDIPPEELTPAMKLQALAAIERVSMLKAELEGVGAEAGRALQILGAVKRDPSLLGEADALLKVAERKGNLQDIARFAAGLKDPAQLAAFAREYTKATGLQKFVEGWRAAIFSGPLTWQANVMGNVAKWTVDVPESIISATITAGRQALKGDPLTMAQYKARALAPLYGLQLAALDGIHLAAEGKALVEANGALEGVKSIMKATRDTVMREDDKLDVYKRANEGVPGALVSAAFGVLKLQDMPFRTVGERGETRIMAVDRAIKEGLHPDTREFREAVENYTQQPTTGLAPDAALAAEKRIANAGAEAVFSQRLGPTSEKLSTAISGTPWEFLFPARRTPANLLSWAVQHTPGLNLFSGRWLEDWKAGGERADKAAARVVVGTALAATAFGLVQQGALTGGGLFDKELSGTKAGAGWQPYSVKVGDTYYSVQRLEPVAKLLMLTGDLHEIIHSPKITPDDKGKAVAMVALAFANATISTTYLSGLSNTMRAALDPERYGQALVESYATSLVPKIIGQPVTMADPFKREVDGALDAIQSQLPFLREKLLAKRDVWGEPSKNERWFDVMPVTTTKAMDDKVKTEAMRLRVAISPPPKFVNERGPFNPREQRTELTGEQRDIYAEVSGTKAMEYLSPIVNAPDWERLPEYVQANIYKGIIEGTRKQGAFAALPPDAATRENVRRRIVDKIIQQTEAVK